jgi:DNA-3-methyladenine glycosylase II
VSALRRLPTNPVDVITTDGSYLHAVDAPHRPAIVRVRQATPFELALTMDAGPLDESERQRILTLIARTLGLDRDLRPFYDAAATLPWLGSLAQRLRGLKPPRYRSLWEAFVHAVVYQQVSLHAASAVVLRIIEAFGTRLESEGAHVYTFPSAERVLDADDDTLRAMGLSGGKLATLRRAAHAITTGTIDAATIEKLPSPEAAALLRGIKGIGPWTASVILLRGLGRLDVFPMNDSGVARNLALAAGGAAPDVEKALDALGAQRGMLYYHLLLARLEASGELGKPSLPRR